ncbi:hypothetical protein [Nonomuraea sp. NPDC003201]
MSFFGGAPFRGSEELTGRVSGGTESWPPTRPGVQRVDGGRLLSASAREVLARAMDAAGQRGAPDLDVLDVLDALTEDDAIRNTLRTAGVDVGRVRDRIDEVAGPGEAASHPPRSHRPPRGPSSTPSGSRVRCAVGARWERGGSAVGARRGRGGGAVRRGPPRRVRGSRPA